MQNDAHRAINVDANRDNAAKVDVPAVVLRLSKIPNIAQRKRYRKKKSCESCKKESIATVMTAQAPRAPYPACVE